MEIFTGNFIHSIDPQIFSYLILYFRNLCPWGLWMYTRLSWALPFPSWHASGKADRQPHKLRSCITELAIDTRKKNFKCYDRERRMVGVGLWRILLWVFFEKGLVFLWKVLDVQDLLKTSKNFTVASFCMCCLYTCKCVHACAKDIHYLWKGAHKREKRKFPTKVK
jgi:hypothetical protein